MPDYKCEVPQSEAQSTKYNCEQIINMVIMNFWKKCVTFGMSKLLIMRSWNLNNTI